MPQQAYNGHVDDMLMIKIKRFKLDTRLLGQCLTLIRPHVIKYISGAPLDDILFKSSSLVSRRAQSTLITN